MRLLPILVLFKLLLAGGYSAAQSPDAGLNFGRPSDTLFNRLFDKYPVHPDSAEAQIWRFLAQAEANYRQNAYLELLNNLQRALALEDFARPNARAVFEANRRMGSEAATLNPRYALPFLKKAYAIAEANNVGVKAPLPQLAGLIAGLYTNLAESDSGLFWYRKALSEAYAHLANIGQASALNNIGYFYSRTGLRDSAMAYFEKALQVLNSAPKRDTVLFCSIRDNIAQEREHAGDYASALLTYQSNDSVYTRQKRWARILPNRLRLFQAKQKLGYRNLGNDIEALNNFAQKNRKKLPDKDMLGFYEFAKNYYFEIGDLHVARRYDRLHTSEKAIFDRNKEEKTDIIVQAFLITQSSRFRRELEIQRVKATAAQQSLRFTQQLILLLVLIGVAGLGVLALLRRRRRREMDLAHRLAVAELRTKALEAQAMTQALELQKRDITTMALHNTQVLDSHHRMIGRLAEIAQQKDNVEQAIQGLMRELQAQDGLGERIQLVQENIERVNAAFYQNLKTNFPTLTKAEIELCGYLRVNLTNKDISVLKNVAPSSVKMGKNRLRKKLGLPAEEDLSAFMQGL